MSSNAGHHTQPLGTWLEEAVHSSAVRCPPRNADGLVSCGSDMPETAAGRPARAPAGERRGFGATHRAVLDAVREGDPDAAETAMRDLLAQAGRDEAAL